MPTKPTKEFKILPVPCCPFCGHVFAKADRILIAKKLSEKNSENAFVLPDFRIICTQCDAEIHLIRHTDYYSAEETPHD